MLLRQTDANIRYIKASLDAIFKAKPVKTVVDIDRNARTKTYKLVFDGVITEEVRYRVASCVTDLRHILDQAACAAVAVVTGAEPGLIYFPIASNPDDLAGRIRKHFPPELHAVLKSFQTYPTGTKYIGGNDPICDLAKSAQRKHRISCNLQMINTQWTINSGGHLYMSAGTRFFEFPVWNADKNEMVIAIAPIDGEFLCFTDSCSILSTMIATLGNRILSTSMILVPVRGPASVNPTKKEKSLSAWRN